MYQVSPWWHKLSSISNTCMFLCSWVGNLYHTCVWIVATFSFWRCWEKWRTQLIYLFFCFLSSLFLLHFAILKNIVVLEIGIISKFTKYASNFELSMLSKFPVHEPPLMTVHFTISPLCIFYKQWKYYDMSRTKWNINMVTISNVLDILPFFARYHEDFLRQNFKTNIIEMGFHQRINNRWRRLRILWNSDLWFI